MKKILLLLALIVSFAFSYTCPIVMEGRKLDTQENLNTVISPSLITEYSSLKQSWAPNDSWRQYWIVFGNTCVYVDGTGGSYRCQNVRCNYVSVSCPSGQSLNSEGICEPDAPKCDPVGAQYLSSATNECVDCMPFTTVSGRASCACDAQGSTYAGQSVLISYSQTYGNYTYQKSLATCANGNQVAVYHDPIPNTPTDNNSTTSPTDNNSTTSPTDTNTSNPSTDNNTTKPSDSNNADVVKAVNDTATTLKSSVDSVKTSTDAVKSSVDSVKTSTDAVKSSVDTSNTKLDSLVSKLTDANSLSIDSKAIQGDIKSALTAEFLKNDKARSDLDARLKNLIDVQLGASSSLNSIMGNTGATVSALNTQGTAITSKLGEILDAIKDANGTDMTRTNDLLEKVQGDTNATVKKLDTLHDDLNSTVSLLDRISSFFDDNKSIQAPDINDTKFDISELLPSDGWFDSNKLNLSFNYGSSCYLEPAEIVINGKSFLFPDPTFVESIPFYIIANLMMAYVYLLGLRDFLKG